MSNELFLVALAVGAALLAVWIHARFPGIAPERMGKTMLHTGIAFAFLRLIPGHGESTTAVLISVFVFVLPALVYALLCSIWMLRLVQTALGATR
ncbi:MAG TPA: hypothetical protein VFV62_06925 [Gaiellaceae bacterium]|nr:hypothetical protein [Gaiellaceae bacterium]